MEVFESDKVLVRTLFNNFESLIVLVFHAKWSQQSQTYLQSLNQLIQTFGPFEGVKIFTVEAETCPQTFQKYEVKIVPTVIFTQTDKTILKRFTKQLPSVVIESLQQTLQEFKSNFEKNRAVWYPKIESILACSPFIIFIKGTPTEPKCGFTSQLLQILDTHKVEYSHCDIIADESMRYWARNYSKWPTYPQIFIKGKLVGGLDVVKGLVAKGQFAAMVPKQSLVQTPDNKFKSITSQNNHVVFLDGFPFQNVKSKECVQRLKEKTNELSLVNARQDSQLMQYLKQQNLSLPAYFHEGQHITSI